MRIFACQHTVGNWDSYGYERGKNAYTYIGANTGAKFSMWTWDIDFTMGIGGHAATQTLLTGLEQTVLQGQFEQTAGHQPGRGVELRQCRLRREFSAVAAGLAPARHPCSRGCDAQPSQCGCAKRSLR